jgi:hypothetical protein
LASDEYREGGVVKLNIAGSREGPYEMLEPDVGKLASPVLRGRGGGNIALLPGRRMATIRVRLDSEDQMKRVTGTKV